VGANIPTKVSEKTYDGVAFHPVVIAILVSAKCKGQ